LLFCRMKISRSSRMTAKKPTATHSPLILVRLILCCGSGAAGVARDGVLDAGGSRARRRLAGRSWLVRRGGRQYLIADGRARQGGRRRRYRLRFGTHMTSPCRRLEHAHRYCPAPERLYIPPDVINNPFRAARFRACPPLPRPVAVRYQDLLSSPDPRGVFRGVRGRGASGDATGRPPGHGLPECPKERSPGFPVTGKLMAVFAEAAILPRRRKAGATGHGFVAGL
jgi:hypothetical protein